MNYTLLSNSEEVCSHKVKRTDHIFGGVGSISRCGKKATHRDSNDRFLCTHHFNRWYKKVNMDKDDLADKRRELKRDNQALREDEVIQKWVNWISINVSEDNEINQRTFEVAIRECHRELNQLK